MPKLPNTKLTIEITETVEPNPDNDGRATIGFAIQTLIQMEDPAEAPHDETTLCAFAPQFVEAIRLVIAMHMGPPTLSEFRRFELGEDPDVDRTMDELIAQYRAAGAIEDMPAEPSKPELIN